MTGDAAEEAGDGARRLILNPTSGTADHVERTRKLAAERGFDVVETERTGHAVTLAASAAADGVDLLAVCGGDGTVHEAVQGLVEADALGDVTLSVVPTGTANIIASALGVRDVEHGFAVTDSGEIRRIDLGTAGDEPFVMSAIAGLPADVSAAATHGLKQRFGPFAFVVGAAQKALEFDGLRVDVEADTTEGSVEWRGEALAVLVGNVRQFAKTGGQANAEDGLLRVTIVEEMPPDDALVEAIEQRLLHEETSHVTDLRASEIDISSLDGGEVRFSLDGEIRPFEDVRITVRPRALRVKVAEEYSVAADDAS